MAHMAGRIADRGWPAGRDPQPPRADDGADAVAAQQAAAVAAAAHAGYRERCARAQAALRAAAADTAGGAAPLGLDKRTSNLFRDRVRSAKRRLDLSEFTHVLAVDPAAGHVDAEGLVGYEALVEATLPHGVMPAVVPQLKTITVGGAVAGVGIEASSFREGLVHDTLLEADVLLAGGELVTCSPVNEHRELFFALPNSYGTLGYATRVRLRTRPVRPFVHVRHERYSDPRTFFGALAVHASDPGVDFLDGVVFGADDLVIEVARFAGDAPFTSDYTGQRIYYRSLRDTDEDWLTVKGWLWRWDTDWFWCSRRLGVQRPWLRRLLGPRFLNSRSYTRVMRLDARLGLSARWARWRRVAHRESVIQDVDVPLAHAAEFLHFLLAEIGIVPIWVCPIRPADAARAFTLYPLVPGARYVNFGFWDTLERPTPFAPGHFNRRIEQRVLALGGIKSLYSDSYFSREEFARAYGLARYEGLKRRVDPEGRLLGLYEKCVLRA